ncbi:hypothetical protein EGC28_03230 [Escherichia coli]|nr:hypothetical protein [Escherichia coli]EFO2097038.1 hypothetical protein [Escherichia coli]PSZ20443.1 hypothetical protein C7B04_03930 [Escherichia sp. 4726-5]PTN22762.1 hypothetical protein A7589_20555 [Escherichia sp. MOD1-EC6475]
MRCRVTWRCSFRSHNLKISTFLKNAHKSDILFSYCDRKQQIVNIWFGEYLQWAKKFGFKSGMY